MKELTEKEAFNKASAYCSKSEHCPSEVREKLYQWGVKSQDIQQRIISRLTDEGYIDEARYCTAFANDKFRFNHWGRMKISLYLTQKGLPQSHIEAALSEITDEASLQTAEALLRTKLNTLHEEDPYTLYAKLMRFAMSRGIEPDIAKQAIHSLTFTKS